MVDIEKLLREGKSPDEIGKIITNEMNAAQKKLNEEKKVKAAAEEEKKKAAEAAKAKETKIREAREVAVAALKVYFIELLGQEIHEDIIRSTFVDFEQSIEAIKSIKISTNRNDIKSILDLLF